MMSYTRIQITDRETILVLKQQGHSQTEIVEKVEKGQSSISRELAKGKDRSVYNPLKSQRMTDKRSEQESL